MINKYFFNSIKLIQVIIGTYSFVYIPIEFILLTQSHSVNLPVLNYLPEFFIGYGVASEDIYIFVGLLFLSFIFFGAFSVKSEKMVYSVICAVYYLADLLFTISVIVYLQVKEGGASLTLYPALLCDLIVLVLYMICIYDNIKSKNKKIA